MKFIIFGLYVAALLAVGIVGMRRTKTLNDFLVAGRNVGPWMSAFSYGTAYFSAVIFVGYAGSYGWGFGLSVLWVVIGNAIIGGLLAWKLLARPTRRMTERMGAMTMASFLEKRYQSKWLKVVSAFVIFIFLVPYSASVYKGLGYIFQAVFGIDFVWAVLFITVMIGIYLTMGGYFSAALADFIQGIIMLIGVVLLVFFVVRSPEVGGFTNVVDNLRNIDPGFVAPTGPVGSALTLFSIVVLTSLGPLGLPQMVQKYYAIKDERVIKTATVVVTLFSAVVAFGAYFTGALSRLFFTDLSQVGGTTDQVMSSIILQTLPEILLVVILIMLFAASMSTLASLVMVSSSAIAVDLMNAIKPGFDKHKSMILMRVLCVVFVLVSCYIALESPAFIVTLMNFSWGVVAGSFLSIYVLGLYIKWITKAGAWAGLITGFSIAVFGTILFPTAVPIVGCCAMLTPLIVVPVVSKLTKPLPQEYVEMLFAK